MKNLNSLIVSAMIAGLTMSAPVLAWDGTASGIPGLIEVTEGSNYGFRLHLSAEQAMCPNRAWAYLLPTDSNYSTYVAVILMSKAQAIQITVFSNIDASGYCHIGDIQVL